MDDYSHRPSELDAVTPEVRSLGAIIARFDVDHQDVARKIGLARSSSLFRVLHGKSRLSPRRKRLAENFISDFLANRVA